MHGVSDATRSSGQIAEVLMHPSQMVVLRLHPGRPISEASDFSSQVGVLYAST